MGWIKFILQIVSALSEYLRNKQLIKAGEDKVTREILEKVHENSKVAKHNRDSINDIDADILLDDSDK